MIILTESPCQVELDRDFLVIIIFYDFQVARIIFPFLEHKKRKG